MKKLLLGALLGALIGAIGLYVYQKTAHRSGAPAGPAETAESALAAASKGSADTGAVLRKVKMTGAVLTVKDGESIQAAVSKAKPGEGAGIAGFHEPAALVLERDRLDEQHAGQWRLHELHR